MNKATEVMMQYVENLKRTYEKDHAELTEFKKLANQNSNRSYCGSVDTGGKTTRWWWDKTKEWMNLTKTTDITCSFFLVNGMFVVLYISRQDFDKAWTLFNLTAVCPVHILFILILCFLFYEDDGVSRSSRSMSLTLGKVISEFNVCTRFHDCSYFLLLPPTLLPVFSRLCPDAGWV